MLPTYELHAGTGFPVPVWDRTRPPRGEVSWVEVDERAVSTSGPGVELRVDLRLPSQAEMIQYVVVRLRDVNDYLPSGNPDYTDPDGNLAITATVHLPPGGLIDSVKLILPYITLPEGVGGLVEAEIGVFEADGTLAALAYYPVELPEEIDRSPDVLTVLAHTLVSITRQSGALDRDKVRRIREILLESFQLDELGDSFLRRILKVANRTHHDVHTLAEVVKFVVPTAAHERFVRLAYLCVDRDGPPRPSEVHFLRELLEVTGIHDHIRHGPERLQSQYKALELEPGATWEEVKRQYKKLVRDYHPDRVSHLASGFQVFANQKVTELNLAYAALREALVPVAVESVVEIDD
jgi:hypothetical protein